MGAVFSRPDVPGSALKDLDWLEHLVNPHCIESGKIWGGMAPLAPLVPPALLLMLQALTIRYPDTIGNPIFERSLFKVMFSRREKVQIPKKQVS